jgi:hypothetical protein
MIETPHRSLFTAAMLRIMCGHTSSLACAKPPHHEIEYHGDDYHEETPHYPVVRHQEERHYPERYREDHYHHYPESYHHRSPPPARYRTSERWDEDPRAERDVHVNVYVENHLENHHEVNASGGSGDSFDAIVIMAVTVIAIVFFALLVLGGRGWYPHGY